MMAMLLGSACRLLISSTVAWTVVTSLVAIPDLDDVTCAENTRFDWPDDYRASAGDGEDVDNRQDEVLCCGLGVHTAHHGCTTDHVETGSESAGLDPWVPAAAYRAGVW
jgi:hypothetical protein